MKTPLEDKKKEGSQSKVKFNNVDVPDLSRYVFPEDYDAFDDENLDMLP
jgi:hypothetical protein